MSLFSAELHLQGVAHIISLLLMAIDLFLWPALIITRMPSSRQCGTEIILIVGQLTDNLMDYSKALTKEELDEFNRILHTLPVDEKTQANSLKYYNDYKSASGAIPADKISTAMKCAFFIAEKSQVLFDIKVALR